MLLIDTSPLVHDIHLYLFLCELDEVILDEIILDEVVLDEIISNESSIR